MDLLKGLNNRQLEAVEHFGSPLLVLAGAGSGKTKVLTTKIAYAVLEKNVSEYEILAITFTNKAGKEMKERIENIFKRDISNIIGTKDDTDRAILLMLYCMRGQFFIDGNKRISMLLANKIMIENGCGLISIPVKERLNFLTLLMEYYETNNSEKIIKFLYDNCLIGNNKIK